MKVATTGDVSRLIGTARVDDALADGCVERKKVQGRWLYVTPGGTIESALDIAKSALAPCLNEWLLNPGHFLMGPAARTPAGGQLGKPALTLLTHQLCARGRLGGLPVLSQDRQPYIAFHLLEDEEELRCQVQSMRDQLNADGEVDWRQLPHPKRHVPHETWRSTIIDHGEWLGLGWQPERGTLRAW